MREISSVVRELHKDKTLRVRQKHQAGQEEPTIYVIVRDKHGKRRWLPLTATLRKKDLFILEEIKEVIEKFRTSEDAVPLPVATGSLATYRRLALQAIDKNDKVTQKTIDRRRYWLNKCVSYLEETDQKLYAKQEGPLREWILQFEPQSRSRREALSAAILLYKSAFPESPVFSYEDLKTNRPRPKARPQHLEDGDLIALLRRVYEENTGVGSVLVWTALTGQRMGAVVCSEWAWGLSYPIATAEGIRLWENKIHRERAGYMFPMFPALMAEFTEGDLRHVPAEVEAYRGPWDRPAKKEEQARYAKALNLQRNWIVRHCSKEEQDALDARTLRHRFGQRCLDRGASVAEVAHWLGTSTQNVESTYSSSWRLRLDTRGKELFKNG